MYALKGRMVINKDSEIKPADEVFERTEIMVFYFAASWCKQCEDLTPTLKAVYRNAKKLAAHLEIINIPVQDTYLNAMKFFNTQGDWYSLIPGDPGITELIWSYATQAPNVTVLTRDGKAISKNGYNELLQYGPNCLVKWL